MTPTEQTTNVVNWQLTQSSELMDKILKSVERHIENESHKAFHLLKHYEGYNGMTVEDVKQDLRLHIIKLCDSYNHKKAANFFTYLTHCKLAGTFVSRIARQHHWCNLSLDIAGRLPARHPVKQRTSYASINLTGQPEEAYQVAELHEVLLEVKKEVDRLPERLRKIITYRYGLKPKTEPMTLESVGKLFNVTRERIRQLEAKALEKLQTEKLQGLLNV